MKQVVALLLLSFSQVSSAGQLIYPQSSLKLKGDLKAIILSRHPELSSENLILKETTSSLLGNHHYFQHVVNGLEVEGSQFVISVDENNQPIKFYDSIESVATKTASLPLLSQAMAYEAAWSHVKASGDLLDAPKAQLVYVNSTLAYKLNFSVSSPAQHHEIHVNAQTGTIVKISDAALPRMKRPESAPVRTKQVALNRSFADALAKFEKKSIPNTFKMAFAKVNGTAQVFDPNPVVSLGRTDLQDTTAASVFVPAYRNEDLLDISLVNGVYTLSGPKVKLIDFEDPYVAPSTTPDGNWVFERKDVKFNDAMTYLHLDRSVRYLESIGFKGSKAIFKHIIEVDANGLSGADNSHYVPYSKRLAFGHGCVDDNEDADVILHELGHAIHYAINPSWGGGDTGAMGEGFGDYWAATYSLTTDNGLSGRIDWVFKWDGHNSCWEGRKLSAFTPTYNASRTYTAHATVDGGITDELWSTPLFQAFLELYNKGVKRADIDKIVLEAHFGLGSGVRIPQMAEAIVKTAKTLYPAKDYDQVFKRHFVKQGILK